MISQASIEYDQTSLFVENFRSNNASGLIHFTGTRPLSNKTSSPSTRSFVQSVKQATYVRLFAIVVRLSEISRQAKVGYLTDSTVGEQDVASSKITMNALRTKGERWSSMLFERVLFSNVSIPCLTLFVSKIAGDQ